MLSSVAGQGHLVGTVIGALPVGLSPGSKLAILTEAHDELASFSITAAGKQYR
jgi:hypothetical protein